MKKQYVLSKYLVLLAVLSCLLVVGNAHAETTSIMIVPQVSDPAAIKLSTIVTSGTVVTKPTCNSGMDARIFGTATQFMGGTTSSLVAMAGVSVYAADNGDGTWTVTGQVKDASSTTWTTTDAIKILIFTRCCTTGTDCQ